MPQFDYYLKSVEPQQQLYGKVENLIWFSLLLPWYHVYVYVDRKKTIRTASERAK